MYFFLGVPSLFILGTSNDCFVTQYIIHHFGFSHICKSPSHFGSSLFLNAPDHLPTSTEIHASMIQFDSRGMLFGPIHFALFKYWQWKNIIIPRKFRRCSRCEDKLLCELDEKQWCISRRRDRKQIDWEREARAADKCL